MEMEPQKRKIPKHILFFIIGVLLGGGVMYYFGYMHGAESQLHALAKCEEKLSLVSNALEKAVNEKTEMEREIVNLNTQMNDLRNILLEFLDSLSGRSVTGEIDNVRITAPAIITTKNKEVCVEVNVENTSDFQKIINIKLSGMGVLSEPSAQTVGPKTTITLPVCGEVEKSVAKVFVNVNGVDVVSLYVLVTEGG